MQWVPGRYEAGVQWVPGRYGAGLALAATLLACWLGARAHGTGLPLAATLLARWLGARAYGTRLPLAAALLARWLGARAVDYSEDSRARQSDLALAASCPTRQNVRAVAAGASEFAGAGHGEQSCGLGRST